jgi:DNA-binding LytR/AlgR family response regulator
MTLKEIADKVPVTDFIQVHRSYLVNANFIDNINTKENTLKVLNKSIDISKNYKENLLQRLNFLR